MSPHINLYRLLVGGQPPAIGDVRSRWYEFHDAKCQRVYGGPACWRH